MKFVLSLVATVVVRAEDPMVSMANMAIDQLKADYSQKQALKKIVKDSFAFKAVIESGDCSRLQKESRKLLKVAHEGAENAVRVLLSQGGLDTQMKAFVEMGKRMVVPQIKLKGNDYIDNHLCETVFGMRDQNGDDESNEGHEEF